eukprot:jgi/Botrbrau1/21114/Bobra.0061s0009.1
MSFASKPVPVPRSVKAQSRGLSSVRRIKSRTNISSSGCTADSTAGGGGVPYLSGDLQRLIIDKIWDFRGKLSAEAEVRLWTNLALVNTDWYEAVSDKPVSLHFPGSPPSDAKQWLAHRSRVRICGLSFLPDEEEFEVYYRPCTDDGGAALLLPVGSLPRGRRAMPFPILHYRHAKNPRPARAAFHQRASSPRGASRWRPDPMAGNGEVCHEEHF